MHADVRLTEVLSGAPDHLLGSFTTVCQAAERWASDLAVPSSRQSRSSCVLSLRRHVGPG